MNKQLTEQNNVAAIKTLVDKVMSIYQTEDYNYIVQLAKRGEQPSSVSNTIAEEVEFIKKNKLAEDQTNKTIRAAAKIILQKIRILNAQVFAKYNKREN